MENLIDKIEQWSIDRNLHTASPVKQFDKLVEEYGELVKGLNKQDTDIVKDSIGDMFVVMIIMCQQVGESMYIVILENLSSYENNIPGFLNALNDLYGPISKIDSTECFPFYRFQDDMLLILEMLNYIADQHNTTVKDCAELAYNEIKDRKGKMIDGKFVKEADLQ